MKTIKQIREERDTKFFKSNLFAPSKLVLEGRDNKKQKNTIPLPQQMPAMLLFRRVAYRLYPDKQVVALYYSKTVNKYLSVPFGPDGNLNLSESVVYNTYDEMIVNEGAKWEAVKGGVKGAVYGAAKGTAIGSIVGHAPGTTAGAVIGAGVGVYKGAKRAYDREKNKDELKSNFMTKLQEIKIQHNEGIVGDTIEKGRSWAKNKLKNSKVFKAAQELGHNLPGYENAKAAKEKFSKGDYIGAAKETGKNIGKAAAVGAGVSLGGYGVARSAISLGSNTIKKTSDYLSGDKTQDNKSSSETPIQKTSSDYIRQKPGKKAVSSWKSSSPATDAAFQSRLKAAAQKDIHTTQQRIRENKISDLKTMIESGIPLYEMNINGKVVTINTSMAKRIIEVYDSVNIKNKKIVENMLNENMESFKKLLNFSIKV